MERQSHLTGLSKFKLFSLSTGENVKKEEDAYPVGRDISSLFTMLWKTNWYYPIKLNMHISYAPKIPVIGIYLKELLFMIPEDDR